VTKRKERGANPTLSPVGNGKVTCPSGKGKGGRFFWERKKRRGEGEFQNE